MKAFFEAIQDLFVNVLFAPLDMLRFAESWWIANIVNWLLFIIGAVAFVYWMLELKKYDNEGKEDRSSTSHSYL